MIKSLIKRVPRNHSQISVKLNSGEYNTNHWGVLHMRMSLLCLGIILVLISHGLHHHTLRQLQSGTTRSQRCVAVYHGFLYLGLAYVAVGLWRPAWLNPRVISLLLLVDGLALVTSYYQHRHQQYPATMRALWRRQAWYLVSSQILLAVVLLGTLVTLPA